MKKQTLKKDGAGYVSSDGRWKIRRVFSSKRVSLFDVDDTLGLEKAPLKAAQLVDIRRWISQRPALPEKVVLTHTGDGYYRADTPMGSFVLDHLIPDAADRAAGHTEKWVMIHPGRPVPDSDATTMRELVENIGEIVDWETGHQGRSLGHLCAESWRLEYHDEASAWGPLAQAYFEQARAAAKEA